jgi:ABC-2 type transport system ATP-binding protein
MNTVIAIKELTKKFNGFVAVDSISFKVRKGDICGFLGPNGAGKTTTIKVLAGLLKPTSGSARILGYDIVEERQKAQTKLGYMPEVCRFPGHFSAMELLDYYGKLFNIPLKERKTRINHLLGLVGLEKWRNERIIKYSKGMVQRLGIAQALVNNPEAVIMDEPTRGLDPAMIVEFRELIKKLPGRGVTILLSSHILSEIEQICTHLAIINKGRLVAFGEKEKLVKNMTSTLDIELLIPNSKVTNALSRLEFVRELKQDGNFIHLILSTGEDVRGVVSKTIYENGGVVLGVSRARPALEEIYLQVTK